MPLYVIMLHAQLDTLIDMLLHQLLLGEVLPSLDNGSVVSLTDGLPPHLAQRRVSRGERGREGKGGTEGMHEDARFSIFSCCCVNMHIPGIHALYVLLMCTIRQNKNMHSWH